MRLGRDGTTRVAEGGGRFSSLLSATIVILIVAVAAFVGLNYFQGPKLRSVVVDTNAVVATSGQQMRMLANQALAQVKPAQVRVTPNARFTVATSGESVDITFAAALAYGTTYRVEVTGVSSRFVSTGSTFAYSFATSSPEVTYLDRADPAIDPGGDDAIRRVTVPGGDPVDIYRAPKIEGYVRVANSLLVASEVGDGSSALDLIASDGRSKESLLLPVPGMISDLEASSKLGIAAFTITNRVTQPFVSTQSFLYAVDLAGDHKVRAITGLDGSPLAILDWVLIPGGSTAAAQADDESIYVVDLAGTASAVPVGAYTMLRGASPDGSQLLVEDIYSAIALSLRDGTQKRLINAPLDDGTPPYVGAVELLDARNRRVEQLAIFDATTGAFVSAVATADDVKTKVIYKTPSSHGTIEDFSVSPNGQYVAIATVPDVATSTPDGASVDPRSTSIVTTIVDVNTGTEVRTVSGFALDW